MNIRSIRRELQECGYRLAKLRKPQLYQGRGWVQYFVWDIGLNVPVLWAYDLDEVHAWMNGE